MAEGGLAKLKPDEKRRKNLNSWGIVLSLEVTFLRESLLDSDQRSQLERGFHFGVSRTYFAARGAIKAR